MALLDEGHQSLLTSRSGSLSDVGLDLAASCGAALLLTIFHTLRPEPNRGGGIILQLVP